MPCKAIKEHGCQNATDLLTSPILAGPYPVLSPELLARLLRTRTLDAWLAADFSILQYRDKSGNAFHNLPRIMALRDACERNGVLLLVNDDPVLAHVTGAHGVHLGAKDPDIATARLMLGTVSIIGISCYKHLDLALQAQAQSADYVSFSSPFASQTKKRTPRTTFKKLAEFRQALRIPMCVIGGVSRHNLHKLRGSGCKLFAFISALETGDPVKSLHLLCSDLPQDHAQGTRAQGHEGHPSGLLPEAKCH